MSGSDQMPPDSMNPGTGSPVSSEPVFLAVGKLRRTHGLEGFLVMEILTDYPDRLKPNRTVYVGVSHAPVKILATRVVAEGLLIRFEGDSSPEEARLKTNSLVFVRADELPSLPEGEYYHHQLIGLQVETVAGEILGTLFDILETGANDVYVVRSPDHAEVLLPAINDVIISVDLTRKVMVVKPPEWD
jgi:16S rRNA processing protein RimM